NLEPHNLIFEAVDWLKTTGAVVMDGDAIAGQGTASKTGVVTSGEWAVNGNKVLLATDAGSTTSWTGDYTFNGVQHINGEDIKNALMYFNQNELVVSQNGAGVAWNEGGGVFDSFHTNATDNFRLTLSEEGRV